MLLTSIPPRLLHRVRDGAAYLHDLASLGLAMLCPCDDDHGRRLRELGTAPDAEVERIARWAEAHPELLDDDAPGWVEVADGIDVLVLDPDLTAGARR